VLRWAYIEMLGPQIIHRVTEGISLIHCPGQRGRQTVSIAGQKIAQPADGLAQRQERCDEVTGTAVDMHQAFRHRHCDVTTNQSAEQC
jgi:hypothetical protein